MTRTAMAAAPAATPSNPRPAPGAGRRAADRAGTRCAVAAVERDWHDRLQQAIARRLGCRDRLADEALRFAYRQLIEQGDPAAATAAAAVRLAFQHAARVLCDRDARRAAGEEDDAFARSLEFPPGQGKVLATVTDPDGRQHKLRYLHPLVADCCELEPPRLVCELVAGEREEQAAAAAAAYADQLAAGKLLGRPAPVGETRALSRRAGTTPA